MRYCGIHSAKIIGGIFLALFLVLMRFNFPIIGNNFPQPRIFITLNKMCFYYEIFLHV